MIEVSNTNAQVIQPGQAVTFDRILVRSGNGECFNRQLGQFIKLRANGCWTISFSGNVTSTTAGDNVQMAVAIAGQPLIETAMNRTIATANNLENISTRTAYKVCCCDLNQVSIINSGTVPVTLAPNSAFLIERKF